MCYLVVGLIIVVSCGTRVLFTAEMDSPMNLLSMSTICIETVKFTYFFLLYCVSV
jgi:hypothetical protein